MLRVILEFLLEKETFIAEISVGRKTKKNIPKSMKFRPPVEPNARNKKYQPNSLFAY